MWISVPEKNQRGTRILIRLGQWRSKGSMVGERALRMWLFRTEAVQEGGIQGGWFSIVKEEKGGRWWPRVVWDVSQDPCPLFSIDTIEETLGRRSMRFSSPCIALNHLALKSLRNPCFPLFPSSSPAEILFECENYPLIFPSVSAFSSPNHVFIRFHR